MKPKFKNLFLIAVLAVYAVLLAIIFLIFKAPIITRTSFIVSMCCMFIPNLAVAVWIFVRMSKPNPSKMISYPVLIYTFIGGNVVLLGAVAALTAINNLTATIVAELVLLLVYGFLVVKTFVFTKAIEKQDEYRKKKVDFKRDLCQKVNAYATLASTPAIAKELRALAEDFRYCDPMSDESLHDEETAIYDAVVSLGDLLKEGSDEDVSSSIKSISFMLKERNAKCLNLK